MFIAIDKYSYDLGESPIFWTGITWAEHLEEAKIYFDADEIDPFFAKVELKIAEKYPGEEKIFERIKLLAAEIFGAKDELALISETEYSDPMIEWGGVSIYWNEHTRIPKAGFDSSGNFAPTLIPGYQVAVVSYNPGVRYHPDGSGTPPDCDVSDLGKPYATLDGAIVAMFELVLKERLNNFFDWEADMAEAQANEDDYEDFWKDNMGG